MCEGNATVPPVPSFLGRQTEVTDNELLADQGKEGAMRRNVFGHKPSLHVLCREDKHENDIALLIASVHERGMGIFADRVRQRIEELDAKQAEIAKRAGLSPSRFGNYVQGRTEPDLLTFSKIAIALETSADWLLGINDANLSAQIDAMKGVLVLDGMKPERAEELIAVALEAMRLMKVLPPAPDEHLRSQMAVQAAWHAASGPRPKQ